MEATGFTCGVCGSPLEVKGLSVSCPGCLWTAWFFDRNRKNKVLNMSIQFWNVLPEDKAAEASGKVASRMVQGEFPPLFILIRPI